MKPDRAIKSLGTATRNSALEEAARIAEKYAEANVNLNPNEEEATVASGVAQSIANTIRSLKS